tara:strand:- start:709 stop:852 length:144 start_codon:yes stop_codon:yes gene_type:complete
MYNFFGYFLTVYLIVFVAIMGWFLNQFRLEQNAINKTKNLNQNKESF